MKMWQLIAVIIGIYIVGLGISALCLMGLWNLVLIGLIGLEIPKITFSMSYLIVFLVKMILPSSK